MAYTDVEKRRHLRHCRQGQYLNSCKYGEEETCPAFNFTGRWNVNSFWRSGDGRKIRLKNLDDNHLRNVIVYSKKTNKPIEFQRVLWRIAKKRGMHDAINNETQTPFQNQNGEWCIYNFDTQRIELLLKNDPFILQRSIKEAIKNENQRQKNH